MRIAFIGLGNMGGGMAANQAKAGRQVDLSLGAGSGVSLNGMASASRRG